MDTITTIVLVLAVGGLLLLDWWRRRRERLEWLARTGALEPENARLTSRVGTLTGRFIAQMNREPATVERAAILAYLENLSTVDRYDWSSSEFEDFGPRDAKVLSIAIRVACERIRVGCHHGLHDATEDHTDRLRSDARSDADELGGRHAR